MKSEGFSWGMYLLFLLGLTAIFALCVCVGSVSVPLGDTVSILWNSLWGRPLPSGASASIILTVRLPRVLCAALCGAVNEAMVTLAFNGVLSDMAADWFGSDITILARYLVEAEESGEE